MGLTFTSAQRAERRPADRRILWIGISLILLVIAGWETVQLWRIVGDERAIGIDPVYYQDMGRRWLETGTFYTADQLAGPYETTTLVTNLYPPIAIYLFVPFVVLPLILWWIIPLAILATVIWYLRPAPWSWPLLALVVALPKTISATIYGNSDLWVAAFVAGGLVLGWPGILTVFKPSLLPLAIAGINRISWWFMAAILVFVNLPLLPLWLQWPSVILNSTSNATYSVGNLPFLFLPVIAWLASPHGSPIDRVRNSSAGRRPPPT